MNFAAVVVVGLCSYLLGSVPFGFLIVRYFKGVDVRSIGSGNIGATNVARTGGKGLAISTFLLDALKGWLPVFLVLHLPAIPAGDEMQRNLLAAFAALMAILGHMFPVWLGFRGGKGVATGLGVFLALAPEAALLALALFAAVVALTRYVSLGSILASAVFPILLWWRQGQRFPAAALLMAVMAALLVIIRHHANIGRLLNGTENRLGARKA
jgi:glycerol-3-phosphate acyltransferase PlsY